VNITSLNIKWFRCFENHNLELNSFTTLITGPNGSGKTSLLEALSYALTARSFKTSSLEQVIKHGNPSCSVIGLLENSFELDTVSIVISKEKKIVKINQKPAKSFRDFHKMVPTIMLTEDDLELVKGSPSFRRSYIDQIALFAHAEYSQELRKFKHILDNRNALLNTNPKIPLNKELYELWTNQLLNSSNILRNKRIEILKELEIHINRLCQKLSYKYNIGLNYEFSYPFSSTSNNTQELLKYEPGLLKKENYQKRSLFGAHLDDILILINNNNARIFASRGQQKFILFLLKLAQAQYILQNSNTKPIFLLDDLMTDFDQQSLNNILTLILKASRQIIATSPITGSLTEQYLLKNSECKIIKLNSL
jgi:DNA replication and repair protein RecF